jgi:hypothetical protein
MQHKYTTWQHRSDPLLPYHRPFEATQITTVKYESLTERGIANLIQNKMTSKLKGTAVTKDYGKRTAIVTGSARGMYASQNQTSDKNVLTRIEGKQLRSDWRKMDLTFA